MSKVPGPETNMRRVNLNIDIDLFNRLEAEAARLHINRSAMLSVILSQYFENRDNIKLASDFMNTFHSGDLSRLVDRVKNSSDSAENGGG